MKALENSAKPARPNRSRLLLAMIVILQGCATVPQVAQTCPRLPEAPEPLDLSEDFQTGIENYLGLEHEPTKSDQRSPPAKPGSRK